MRLLAPRTFEAGIHPRPLSDVDGFASRDLPRRGDHQSGPDLAPATSPRAGGQAWRRAIDIYDRIDPKLAAAPRRRLDELEAATA